MEIRGWGDWGNHKAQESALVEVAVPSCLECSLQTEPAEPVPPLRSRSAHADQSEKRHAARGTVLQHFKVCCLLYAGLYIFEETPKSQGSVLVRHSPQQGRGGGLLNLPVCPLHLLPLHPVSLRTIYFIIAIFFRKIQWQRGENAVWKFIRKAGFFLKRNNPTKPRVSLIF